MNNTSLDSASEAPEQPKLPPDKEKLDIFSSLRHLNSCITLSVKEGANCDSRSPSPSDSERSGSSGEEEDSAVKSRIPSALYGISIKSSTSSKESLNQLLSKTLNSSESSKLKEDSGSNSAAVKNSGFTALRGVSVTTVSTAGVTALKNNSDKTSERKKEGGNTQNNLKSNSLLSALRGVSIQGVKVSVKSRSGDNDSETNSSKERNIDSLSKENDNVNTQRNLKSKEESSSESSSAASSPGIPSALRDISIQGASKELLLSNILGKSKEPEENKKAESESKWINEWSKRCLSISFSSQKKNSEDEYEDENDVNKQTTDDSLNNVEKQDGSRSDNGTSVPQSENSTPDTIVKHPASNDLPQNLLAKVTEALPSEVEESKKSSISLSETTKEEATRHKFNCHICGESFRAHIELKVHIQNCPKLTAVGVSESFRGVARKKTTAPKLAPSPVAGPSHPPVRAKKRKSCIYCGIYNFKSYLAFEEHHAAHIRNSQVEVYLKRVSPAALSEEDRKIISNHGGNLDLKRLKLTFKISKNKGKGKKSKTVQIVNNQEMAARSLVQQPTDRQDPASESNTAHANGFIDESVGNDGFHHPLDSSSDSGASSNSQVNFGGFEDNIGFNTAENERPPSTYQPQFESFPGDWFNEYESGSRIAAAMAGTSGGNGVPNMSSEEFPSPQGDSGYEDSNHGKGMEQPENADGLFSQAVLGGECPPVPSDERQGSFEQLCLNDSFGHGQEEEGMAQSEIGSNFQESQQFHTQQQGSNDLLSELAYLNNTNQQGIESSSSQNSEQPFSSRSSNSGTPNSSTGHLTPPATDTSFRALATSPTSPLNSGGPTPPMQSGSTPPIPNVDSPLQQMGQLSQCSDSLPTPRLTIANNLMPTTTNNLAPVNSFNQQWPAGNTSQNFNNSSYLQNSSLAGRQTSTYPTVPMGYRPSPPPRIRGRPPLMGHIVRPPMIRGGITRPPGATGMPPLAPGRGGMMPTLRHSQFGGRGGMSAGQKRTIPQIGQSPNKTMRRDDINVPTRQKDSECQIIAVANRVDGMPVISNVQGRDERSKTANSSESTIHLSDSITLSVRSNQPEGRVVGRGERGGDAGVVANLLASRGITVTPAAGEKEGNTPGREERRLPSASDLNLSSAISVHPPTSRDRDGFAVPHPPSSKSSSSVANHVDRPPRPPTVDLTQELSPVVLNATRLQCSQCERSFPTQSLLSDHAKVHQQQAQSRMPFKCHLCSAGFSTQKGQQHHYQNFHQLHLSAGDLAIPIVDFRNPVNIQRMASLGIRSFLPLSNLQNRGAGGVVGIPVLTLENLRAGQMNMQQWGISDVLTLGPPKTLNPPR